METSLETLSASYQYDPFGNITSESGALASVNTYQFSSKEMDPITGLYYYGYRWYAPYWGRWVNRDPLAERYDINLFRLVYNDPIAKTDRDGFGPNGDPVYGSGKLCTSKDCNKKRCRVQYLPEDENKWKDGFKDMPEPGKCVDADAVCRPGEYLKVPNNCRITIKCYSEDSWRDNHHKKGEVIKLSYLCWGAGPVLIGKIPTPAPVPPFPPCPIQ